MTSRILYDALLVLHAACAVAGLVLFHRARDTATSLIPLPRVPEFLFALTGVFFLFTYIYATNANMDYVQRFMSSHGNLLLAPNSTAERLDACLRFLPLLAFDGAWYVAARVRTRTVLKVGEHWASTWALPLTIGSGILYALAFPSFIRTGGLPVLGWFCLVPLLVCLSEVPMGRGVFYGTLAGVLQTMISNYWLGTFNLLTLQFVTVVTALEYVPFMALALLILKRAGNWGFLVFPAAWTVFDWARSMGFLGYPWGMLGTSQYAVLPVIQVASLTGVWGVTFLVMLCNAVLAAYARAALVRARVGPVPVIVCAACIAFSLVWSAARPAPGTLINLANLQRSQGQLDDAAGNYEEAGQLARDTDDKPQLVRAQLGKGAVLYQKADYENAVQTWEHARQSATELGDKVNVAKTSMNLATLLLQLGDLNEAERNVRQAISVGQGAALQRVYASSLNTLGDVQMARGDLPGARKSYQEALDLFTKFEDQASIAASRLSLAGTALEEGDTKGAEALARQAIAAFQSERTPDEEASAHETLARVLMAQGKRDQALAEIDNAKALASQDHGVGIAVAVTGARLDALKGNAAEARQSLESSLVEARRLKLTSAQLDIRLALAEIERSSHAASARAQTGSLEQDARNSGYLLIAAKAARLQRLGQAPTAKRQDGESGPKEKRK